MVCSLCGGIGHNKRTCKNKDPNNITNILNDMINKVITMNKDLNEVKKSLNMIIIKIEKENKEKISPNIISDKRKSCEYNWAELLICMLFLYPGKLKNKDDINSYINILKNDSRFYISGGVLSIDKYLIDINSRSNKIIKEYINNIDINCFPLEFTKMILSGKSYKEYPELIKLNTDINTGELYDGKVTKSDVYVIYTNNYIGFSVKDSNGATLTNYSIEKIFNELKIEHSLKENRINILKGWFGDDYKYNKFQRAEANKLFYDKNNEYFKNIIKLIETNEQLITKKILSYVFPKLDYDVYGYNGKKLVNLNDLCEKTMKQSCNIKRETKYETDTSAKLWYSLYLDDIEKWKFCIRGKNEIYKGSFQILEFTKC